MSENELKQPTVKVGDRVRALHILYDEDGCENLRIYRGELGTVNALDAGVHDGSISVYFDRPLLEGDSGRLWVDQWELVRPQVGDRVVGKGNSFGGFMGEVIEIIGPYADPSYRVKFDDDFGTWWVSDVDIIKKENTVMDSTTITKNTEKAIQDALEAYKKELLRKGYAWASDNGHCSEFQDAAVALGLQDEVKDLEVSITLTPDDQYVIIQDHDGSIMSFISSKNSYWLEDRLSETHVKL